MGPTRGEAVLMQLAMPHPLTGDLWALLAALLLATVQIAAASVLTLRQLGGAWVAGPRDGARDATGISGRPVNLEVHISDICDDRDQTSYEEIVDEAAGRAQQRLA